MYAPQYSGVAMPRRRQKGIVLHMHGRTWAGDNDRSVASGSRSDQGSRILHTVAEERTCQRVPELGRPVEKRERDVYVSVIRMGWFSSHPQRAAAYGAGHETIIRSTYKESR